MKITHILLLAVLVVLAPACGRRAGMLGSTPQRVPPPVITPPVIPPPVGGGSGAQLNPRMVPDGSGGAILVWQDGFSAPEWNIYAQRLDGTGAPLWKAGGVPICTATGEQSNPRIASDGAGGAIIVWQDARGGGTFDLYAQRINGAGTLLWTATGVPLCVAPNEQSEQQMVSDGQGGAVVTWIDGRAAGQWQVYAQRINGAGTAQWAADGVVICTKSAAGPQLDSDGTGGAIIVWQDYRVPPTDVYAQRIHGTGTVLWTTDGVPVCTAPDYQLAPQLVSDGSGGAIVAWSDARVSQAEADIYAQHLNDAGTPLWTTNGLAVCTAPNLQNWQQIISDGSGGAIMVWQDNRADNSPHIYSQRVTGAGNLLWTPDGVQLSTATLWQSQPQLASDDNGGAVIVCENWVFDQFDIHAQRIDSSGTIQWSTTGAAVCLETGRQERPRVIRTGPNKWIAAWEDYRAGATPQVFVQALPVDSPPDQGIPVATLSTSNQMSPEIASDGAGGAIIFWLDTRDPGGYSIYAQRITQAGKTLWTTDGVPICVLPGSRWNMQAVPDGAGGATVVWGDDRNGSLDIYAQRVNGAGVVQWTNNGVAVCSAFGEQDHPELAPDGTGGAVVAWQDHRTGSPEVYSQRINGAGALQWPAAGVLVCSVASLQSYPRVVTDGAQGGIVVWQDNRSPGFSVFAQRVNSAGVVQWTADGVLLCGAPNSQADPEAISDGAGGAIVAWFDVRSGTSYDIYAQRINGSGTLLWTADGAPICTAAGNQDSVQLTADGSGGAIIAWTDHRSGTGYDLYAQRVNSAGTRQWATDGVAICTSGGVSWEPQVVSDGAGGAIIAWTDNRNTVDNDAYVQRVNSSGVVQWTTNGLPVCTVTGDLFSIQMVSDGLGGAIMTWDDRRNPTPDIYAQPVSAAGTFP